jgi:two-component system response regulator FixJ
VNQTKAKIYVVDDDESVRVSLHRLLHAAGMQSQSFAAAAEFLRHLQSSSAGKSFSPDDCAIVDVHMPSMTGTELLKCLARDFPTLRVVLISASLDPDARNIAEATGVVLLKKPFDDTALFAAIAPPATAPPATARPAAPTSMPGDRNRE